MLCPCPIMIFFSRLSAEKYNLYDKKKGQKQKYQDKYKYEFGSDQWKITKTRWLQKQDKNTTTNTNTKDGQKYQDKGDYKNKDKNTKTNTNTKERQKYQDIANYKNKYRNTKTNTNTKLVLTSGSISGRVQTYSYIQLSHPHHHSYYPPTLPLK